MASWKAVVVGAGGISGAWFPHLITEGVEVVGLVDLDTARAQEQARKHGLAPVISKHLAATLRRTKPDFVVDLTVPDAHCRVTCTALRAGYPVIGEKPMAASLAAARRMLKASEASGKLYMVSQSRRYIPRHAALQRYLAGSEIGPLTTLTCNFFMGCHFGGFRDEIGRAHV